MEAPEDLSTLLQPEKELPSLTAKSFWDVVAPSHRASDTAYTDSKSQDDVVKGESKRLTTSNFNIIFAGFILLIAIISGLLFHARNSN